MFSLFVRLHGFHHFASCAGCESTQKCHVGFEKTSAPRKQESLQIYQNLEHILLLGINLFFRLLSKGPATFPHYNN